LEPLTQHEACDMKNEQAMNLTDDQLAVIDTEIYAGNHVSAIRHLRGFTGAGLVEAKSFVDLRQRDLLTHFPERFAVHEAERPLVIDDAISSQLRLLSIRELSGLGRVLDRLRRTVSGDHYQVSLDSKLVHVPLATLPRNEVLRLAYPKSAPQTVEFLPVTVQQLTEHIESCFTYEGDNFHGPGFSPKRRELLTKQLIPTYWRRVDAIVPRREAALYFYDSSVGLPVYDVWWFFAYLVHDTSSERCLILAGASSD